jgi:hypothetical protein
MSLGSSGATTTTPTPTTTATTTTDKKQQRLRYLQSSSPKLLVQNNFELKIELNQFHFYLMQFELLNQQYYLLVFLILMAVFRKA